jgi:signal peptidase II
MSGSRRRKLRASEAAAISAAVTVVLIFMTTKVISGSASALDGVVIVPGLLKIVIAHNPCISFGLLCALGSTWLVVTMFILTAALAFWAYKATQPTIGVALGAIIGGALANIVDRATHGTVFDFLFVHLGALPLFVCNAPDIAITIGAIILVWELVLVREPQGGEAPPA